MNHLSLLNPVDLKRINHVGLVILHAAQYPAMAGKYLVEQKPDDSNTNLKWIPDKNIFVGNLIENQYIVGLEPVSMELMIMDKDYQAIQILSMGIHTRKEIYEWLKKNLAHLNVDVSSLQEVMHYEIPPLTGEEEWPFHADPDLLIEWSKYRTASNQEISSFANHFSTASEVRVWPHHFDTGTYIPLETDKNQEPTKSIGLGFAIADTYVAEPYYYINNWHKKGPLKYTTLPNLEGGGIWNEKDWVGAVLPLSAIISQSTVKDQHALVTSFFVSGINHTLRLLGIPRQISN